MCSKSWKSINLKTFWIGKIAYRMVLVRMLKWTACLGLILGLWLGYHEHKLLQDHLKGNSCKDLHLGLGQENPLWEDDLKATIPGLERVLSEIMDLRKEGKLDDPNPQNRFKRVQHPVAWGCVQATVDIFQLKNSSDQQGLFAQAKIHPAIVRFSKNAFLPDFFPKATSIAVKILDLEAQRADMKEQNEDIRKANQHTQDLIMIGNPIFPLVAVPQELTILHEYLAKKQPFSAVFYLLLNRPTLFIRTIVLLWRGFRTSNPLLENHYTIQASRLGPNQAIRLALEPCESTINYSLLGGVNITANIQSYLNMQDGCMKLMMQKQTEACRDQVDDFIHEWSGPWLHVGYLKIKQGSTLDSSNEHCDNLSFNPFHAPDANRPLGWLGRLRRDVYAHNSARRYSKNTKTLG